MGSDMGEPLRCWTQETLLGSHASHPFNPDIANTFFRAGEIEAWGRGIERIFAACHEEGAPVPQVRLDAGGMWTEFSFADAYLRLIGGGAARVTPPVTPEVTPEVGRMLGVLKGEMTRSEIMAILQLRDEKHFREKYQQTGIESGLIEMTLPDKPNSRLQQYRLTEKGRAALAGLRGGEGG